MRRQADRIEDLESQLAKALATVHDLRAENERLRAHLDVGPPEPTETLLNPPASSQMAGAGIDARSPESAKIALFRSLFRGREDVYAYRWEAGDGRSGYSPALRPGAKRHKGQRPDPTALLSLDDDVVQSHLLGQRVIGIYPLLEDETCWFLAIDFVDPGIQEIYSRLAKDRARTEAIVADVLEAVGHGRSPLVLTERTEHLEQLRELIAPQIEHLVVLRGGMGAGERKAIAASLKSIPDDAPRVLLATGRYIGEGFDDARLDTLFLALPVSWRGTIEQYAGRLHRLHDRKRDVTIFDYVDVRVPMLAKMHQKRLRGYAAIGYSVEPLSESTLPAPRLV